MATSTGGYRTDASGSKAPKLSHSNSTHGKPSDRHALLTRRGGGQRRGATLARCHHRRQSLLLCLGYDGLALPAEAGCPGQGQPDKEWLSISQLVGLQACGFPDVPFESLAARNARSIVSHKAVPAPDSRSGGGEGGLSHRLLIQRGVLLFHCCVAAGGYPHAQRSQASQASHRGCSSSS